MLKPTPSNATKKTASAHSVWHGAIVVAVACAVLLVAIVSAHRSQTATLRANGVSYTLAVVSTNAARAKGLGGRAGLAPNAGMLFVFSAAGQQCFWMKDMRFALDIIWVDAGRRVVHVVPDISPATYPATYCAPSAQYVIELGAGQASRAGIAPGERLSF